MRNESLVRIWLKRAKSNLQIAKAGKVFEDILYEDLCFEYQEALETAKKVFDWVRNIIEDNKQGI